MKKFKSIVAVVLLVALVLSMLTGCTGKGKKNGNTYTITSISGLSKSVNVSITFTGKLLSGTYTINDPNKTLKNYLGSNDLHGTYSGKPANRMLINSKNEYIGSIQINESGNKITCDFYMA